MKSYVLLFVLLVALLIFLYTLQKEQFSTGPQNDPGYASYVKDLVNSGVPFGRVFSREAYLLVKKSKEPGQVIQELANLD